MVTPLKLRFGVKVIVPSGLIVTAPSREVAVVTVNGSLSTSLSLARTATVTGVSSGVVAVSFRATGGSLTGRTITSTIAVSKPPWPSLMVYDIVATPLKFGVGVKVIVPFGLITTVPSGDVARVTVSRLPSRSLSLARMEMVTGVSSSVEVASFTATGASFCALTVTVTVAVDVPPLPSLIV